MNPTDLRASHALLSSLTAIDAALTELRRVPKKGERQPEPFALCRHSMSIYNPWNPFILFDTPEALCWLKHLRASYVTKLSALGVTYP